MAIKLLTGLAGADYSYAPGEVVTDLDKDHEKRLIESGQAERVTKTRAKKSAPDAETPSE